MSRPLRIEYEGAWYHVMNRGRGRESIFVGEEDYALFLETLGEAADRFRGEIHAYCLMPNHYHLLVRTPLANLARVMRHVDGLYTQRYNRRHGTDGPLFRGRYRAILVDADAYLLSVSRYIHRNPIDGKHPLVERLEEWLPSSYPAYTREARAPRWLQLETTLERFGTRNRFAAYRRFVGAEIEGELAAFYANQRATPVLGDESFRERVLSGADLPAEVARPARRPLHTPQQVLAAVAEAFGVDSRCLLERGAVRGGNEGVARQAAMRLCRDYTGLTLREIGERFGAIHYSAVNQNIRRLSARIEANGNWARSYDAVLSRLDP